jgi:hypothetical protein
MSASPCHRIQFFSAATGPRYLQCGNDPRYHPGELEGLTLHVASPCHKIQFFSAATGFRYHPDELKGLTLHDRQPLPQHSISRIFLLTHNVFFLPYLPLPTAQSTKSTSQNNRAKERHTPKQQEITGDPEGKAEKGVPVCSSYFTWT